MDTNYHHFQYSERLAIKLKAIRHTKENPKFFRAFGLEELIEFSDKLSYVSGMILIAIDGYESKVFTNQSDALFRQIQYSLIVAGSTDSDDSATLFNTINSSQAVVYQIISRLMLDNIRFPFGLDTENFEINGIGPVGDNFYGVILSFSVTASSGYTIDQSYWEE